MLIVLRLADKKEPVMDKLHFYIRRMDETIVKSKLDLDSFSENFAYSFLSSVDKIDDSNIPPDGDSESGDEAGTEDDEEESEDATVSLGSKVQSIWIKRRTALATDFSIAGWMLSPIPEVFEDSKHHALGAERNAVERLLKKMYTAEFAADSNEVANLLNTFWNEYEDFKGKSGPFDDRPHIWVPSNGDLMKGHSHFWHKKNSIPYTKVLGKFACRVCSKIVGMGSAERNWGDVKHLKTDKRSHLSSEAAKKQATIFGASCMEDARLQRKIADEKHNGGPYAFWDENDFDAEFDLLAGGTKKKKADRVFKCYMEDWEADAVLKKDPVSEARLLKKYGGLQFYDVDTEKNFYIDGKKLHWVRPRKTGGGYSIIAYNEDYNEDNPRIEDLEYFAIFEKSALLDLLQMYYKKNQDKGVKLVQLKSDEDEEEELDESGKEVDTPASKKSAENLKTPPAKIRGKKQKSSEESVTESENDDLDTPLRQLCRGCGKTAGPAHKCDGCGSHMHPFCGQPIGEEGHGQIIRCKVCVRKLGKH